MQTIATTTITEVPSSFFAFNVFVSVTVVFPKKRQQQQQREPITLKCDECTVF